MPEIVAFNTIDAGIEPDVEKVQARATQVGSGAESPAGRFRAATS